MRQCNQVIGMSQSFGLLTTCTDSDQTDSKQKKIRCKGQSIAQFFHLNNFFEKIYDFGFFYHQL